MDIEELKKKANQVRRQVLKTVIEAGGGHIGGTFSSVEILVSLYYGKILNVNPEDPKWDDRDRFICKGQLTIALYNILADLGFLDMSVLQQYGENGSCLGGEFNIDTPGIEYNTGSLGNAPGVAAGMALAAKMDNKKYKTVFLIGDGECDEGSVWESAMFASRHQLNNLIGIVDRNRLGVVNVMEDNDLSGTLDEKFGACGWRCSVINGHCFEEILNAFSDLDRLDKPLMIIANTIKGKGVSFMENGIKWHHSVPNIEEFELAMKELEQRM